MHEIERALARSKLYKKGEGDGSVVFGGRKAPRRQQQQDLPVVVVWARSPPTPLICS